MSQPENRYPPAVEAERRKLAQTLEDVLRLCESGMPALTFYGEMLRRLFGCLGAVAGAVWMQTPRGNLVQQSRINLAQAGLDPSDAGRENHHALLRMAFASGESLSLAPPSAVAPCEPAETGPSNPSTSLLLLVPIRQKEQTVGLIEIFKSSQRWMPSAVPGYLIYMKMMADITGRHPNLVVLHPGDDR